MEMVRADDTAGILYKQGADALSAGQYAQAVQAFDQILTGYPNMPNIDDVRLRAGFAYMHMEKYDEAVDRLSKEILPVVAPAYRGTALYYTGLSQFYKGTKLIDSDPAKGKDAFGKAAATFSTLIDSINTAPDPQTKGYLEEAIYFRALSNFERDEYDPAEKDLLQLIQQFSSSLLLPDYYLRLGSLYAVETNKAVIDKKSPEEVRAMAQKALDVLDHVSNDPNALIQANEANMNKAEILYLIAQLDNGDAGYMKALEAYRLVRRKADLIPLQQDRLDELKRNSANALQNAGAMLANENSRLIDRETNRLDTLKDPNMPDPIIQALIRMAECYNAMKQADEARTILHRLVAKSALNQDQQQEVDFQLLYSYVLGGETDKADKALTDYLTKHAGDPQADSISYQISAKLMDRKDYEGSLKQAQRSLQDFPKGRYVSEAIGLEAQALTSLGRLKEADAVVNNFLAKNPNSPVANSMLMTRAQGKSARRDYAGALEDYQKVRDNPQAGDLRPIAAAGCIQALYSLQRFDDVLKESKDFTAKYPTNKTVSTVLLFAALSLDQKNDHNGAVAALQDIAKKYPKDDAAPFALSYVVHIYDVAGSLPQMIQAANDLRAAYPNNYPILAQAADEVSATLVKQKQYDQAIAQYQPLIDVPTASVAATSRNKIGDIWLAEAKNMRAYQSMNEQERPEAEKVVASAEEAYLGTLQKFPEQTNAAGDAFGGLVDVLKQRRSWGLLTDATMEGYLAKLGSVLTLPDMKARLEMAEAGLVFTYKNGVSQYPAALDRFRKVVAANPSLPLTRQEADQYGELLIAAKDYATALQVYGDLLGRAAPNDMYAQADGDYGLGAAYLAQGDVANAARYFSAMKSLPNGAAWHPHIMDANYGLALAAEKMGDPHGVAMQIYSQIIQSSQAPPLLMAKSMLGYGHLLEKAGHGLNPAVPDSGETALRYYIQASTQFGLPLPQIGAEGLFSAGQLYEKAGDKANAKKQFTDLIGNYGESAPDWVAKAKAELDKLGP